MMVHRPLTNHDLNRYAEKLRIKNFRGVYMLDDLPKRRHKNESAIVNLDTSDGPGTHWICYRKNGENVNYFDSLGNLRPPIELMDYFGSQSRVRYNYTRKQPLGTDICGHLCLQFLLKTNQ